MPPAWNFPLAAATAKLPDDEQMRFHYALRHGSMKLGLYAPVEHDTQGPHKQDELYIVVSGSGTFMNDGESRDFGAGDALFVEAGKVHRFETFSKDFASWVIFWGAEGGEAA